LIVFGRFGCSLIYAGGLIIARDLGEDAAAVAAGASNFSHRS
jgi:hypothetical protein